MSSAHLAYSKSMIDLIHGIRQRMPAKLKSGVRFSNPDIFTNMAAYHKFTNDTDTKTMIENLLSQAGEPWQDLLAPEPEPEIKQEQSAAAPRPSAHKRIYRGQVVNG